MEWNGMENNKYGTRRKRLEQLHGTVWNENTEQEEKGWNGTEWKKQQNTEQGKRWNRGENTEQPINRTLVC